MKKTLLVLATLLSGCDSITNKNSCEDVYNKAIIAELEGDN